MQSSSALVKATTEAVNRGYQIIPLTPEAKNPRISGWPHFRWPEGTVTKEQVVEQLTKWSENVDGDINLGVILGDASMRLVDIDLDHYRTARLKEYFLPPTPARSGRPGKPNSHYWYLCEEGTLPGTRQHLMPRALQPDGTWKKGPVIVELRANAAQTMIPPSIWKDKASDRTELTAWTGPAWGGKAGPQVVNGRRLSVQVALLALASVLLDSWPTSGSRHEAYLALAGGLLRAGDGVVHPWWEQNAAVLIRALADATLDDDGADARETESIQPTVRALQNGKAVTGFGKLAELLGDEVVKQVRLLVGEVEQAAGVTSRQAPSVTVDVDDALSARDEQIGSLSPEERDPLGERVGSWEPVDLEPYLSGQVQPAMPELLRRSDNQALLYSGRVNMLYGSSESAKSWIALNCGLQEMAEGNRVMYVDFEDEPVNTLDRLKRMGAGADDLRFRFSYVRPEDPIEAMQRDRWGNTHITPAGEANEKIFAKALETIDPTLIIADGMTVLYGLHGLDSNDAVSTDIITGWLKKMTRNGRTTVIVIDHTGKGSERGTTPIGAHHKQAMVQGAMIQVWPVRQPMPDAVGQVELIVIKDRPGQVRKISVKSGNKAQLAAVVTIDSTVKDITTMTIDPPPDPNDPQQQAKKQSDIKKHQMFKAEEQAVRALFGDELGKAIPLSGIFQAMGMEREDTPAGSKKLGEWKDQDQVKRWASCVKRLMEQGWLYSTGNTKARQYVLAMTENDPNGMDVDLTGQPDND